MTSKPSINNVSRLLVPDRKQSITEYLYEDAWQRLQKKEEWVTKNAHVEKSEQRKKVESKIMLSKMAKDVDVACCAAGVKDKMNLK